MRMSDLPSSVVHRCMDEPEIAPKPKQTMIGKVLDLIRSAPITDRGIAILLELPLPKVKRMTRILKDSGRIEPQRYVWCNVERGKVPKWSVMR